MLRIGLLETVGSEAGPLTVPPALIARALGDLVSERLGAAGPSFAIEQVCAALVDADPFAGQACIERLHQCGVSVEALYDTYIPRAAQRLGEMWVADELPFAGVTLAMVRLTEAFRRLSPVFLRETPRPPRRHRSGRRALLALAPGEDHALGVVMAADYFQRAGWSVRVELRADDAMLETVVARQPFDVIGLSGGSRRMIPVLRRTMERLRPAAAPGARFLLGGPLVALDRDAGEDIGVDFAAATAADALNELEKGA